MKTDSNLLENLIKDGKCIGHDWNHVFGKRLTLFTMGAGAGTDLCIVGSLRV